MKLWDERIRDQNDWNTPNISVDRCSHCNKVQHGFYLIASNGREVHICADCLVTLLLELGRIKRNESNE